MKELDLRNSLRYAGGARAFHLYQIPSQKMAVVEVVGDPNEVSQDILGALYATVYEIRKQYKNLGTVFSVEKLRGRWPDGTFAKPKALWEGTYGLPVPADVTSLPELPAKKQVPGVTIRLQVWHYGTVASMIHVGSYADEHETIAALQQTFRDSGYHAVRDSHEEVYLSDPRKTVPSKLKTLIIYRIEKD